MLSEKTSRRPVALDERPAHTALRSPSRPTASIARSISWGFTWRKLVHWLLEDVLVVSLLICAFVWHCTAMLPAAAADGITENVLGTPIVEPSHCVFTGNGTNISTWKFTIHGGDGAEYATMMEPYVRLLIPPAAFMLFCQVLDLFDFFSDTRRVRRKLQPLNDLAIAAEAIGQVTASRDPMTDDDKMATLEQAIERATVDSPTVSTGDKDLRSIEVALNGLLRQMQEAKLQQMRFVSDASHELRTPIAVIQGYVNMLDRWGKTDESVLEESIEALKAESDHMQELVEQLLFLARGDSGRNALNRTDVNIAQVVHEVWEESCMIDEQHDYRCTVSEDDTQSDRLLTEGDLAMLKQSLRIIVQNAEKYSPTGSTITLSARREGQSVCYSVQDEGIGMSEADVRHIFERFYRAEGARDGKAAGTGLGLSIAKWIVDAHEGSIEVVSREGVGTRFIVRLPAKQV
ncbi:MAG: HAMP domain-containing histidine kinase [Atopobiaceae bacterium]|nr:HAMP domain-containing histidine kinase [Atopobiaceae bacterium]